MKKILVIVVCVFMTSYGFAQDFKFGAKAGLNLSNIVGSDYVNIDVDMKAGLYFGGFLNTALNDRLSFQPELLYSEQGWIVDGEDVNLFNEISYLNIPLLLRISLGVSDKVYVYSGPQVGFLLKSKIKIGNDDDTLDMKDVTNSVNFSLNLGLSFVVSDNIALDVRYNRGLSNIQNLKGMGDVDLKGHSSVIQIGASYSF